MNRLKGWLIRYRAAGMSAIPLKPDSKMPLDEESWKLIPPDEQWKNAGKDFTGNIGIIAGNGLAVIDSDGKNTTSAVERGLDGMGLCPPLVGTPAKDGRHFYLHVTGVPENFNYELLNPNLGPGELRAANSYVVAPCSKLAGREYQWLRGAPEDIPRLRAVKWKDLAWLLRTLETDISEIDAPPIRLLRRKLPKRADELLSSLASSTKGQRIGEYESRSHAEAAVIAMLILAGWTYDDILAIFDHRLPGKYDESGKYRAEYFDRTYRRVLSHLAGTPERKIIAEAWHTAIAVPWPGRSGLLNRDTYLGILAICWQCDTWQVRASERDLAEYAATTREAVHNAIQRLQKPSSLITRLKYARNYQANLWNVTPLNSLPREPMTSGKELRGYSPDIPPEACELWSKAKLGRAAGAVYSLLGDEPMSIGELSRRTCKAWNTVKNALKRLESHGLAVKKNAGWLLGNSSIDSAMRELGARQAASRRRNQHEQERDYWRFERRR